MQQVSLYISQSVWLAILKHGAGDKTDMQISLTEGTRKTCKGYRKLFFHLNDMCLYNVFVLYKVNNSNKKIQFIEFRKNVVELHIELHRPPRIRNTGGRPSIAIPLDTNPLCLVGKLVPSIKRLSYKTTILVFTYTVYIHLWIIEYMCIHNGYVQYTSMLFTCSYTPYAPYL